MSRRWPAFGRGALAAIALAAAVVTAPARLPAAADPDPSSETILFAMSRVAEEMRRAAIHFQTGDRAGAMAILDALIDRHPDIGPLRLSRAVLAMQAGDTEAAIAHLEVSAATGTPRLAAALADPVFDPLSRDPATAERFAAVAAAAPPPEREAPSPTLVRDGVAEVSGANTTWNPTIERLEPRFALPEAPAAPVLPRDARDAARDLLRDHWEAGRAAGNHGDLYDNRDRGHSALDLARFPQVTRIAYDEAARRADVDYALNDQLLFDRVTFGNSSTAMTGGAHWRSLPRYALTRPDGTGPMRLWQNWAANHLYIHPAHQDWGREAGDLFPANTPYIIISRGSSGSDRPFLEAVAMILASFRPETKARLIDERLIVPTVQFVFRRSLRHIRSRESYFSGAAHPAVFKGGDINLARMVSLAQSIEPGAIPAEVRIEVLEEALGQEGIDFFGAGLGEQLFDTPSAVARIWRAKTGRRTMLVTAAPSRDANGRPLTFHWRLLQGNPERVTIEPFDDGVRARIVLDWHDPFRTSGSDSQLTSRVDIGVFANNGVHDSAPAILSWHFPPHESRTYETGSDGIPRIAAIDYTDPARADVYSDPLIWPRASWRDAYAYDTEGRITGWTRHRGDRTDTYDPQGRRLLGPDHAETVTYALVPEPNGTLQVEERSADLMRGH